MKKTKNVIGPRAISHAVLSQCLEQVRNQIVLAQRSTLDQADYRCQIRQRGRRLDDVGSEYDFVQHQLDILRQYVWRWLRLVLLWTTTLLLTASCLPLAIGVLNLFLDFAFSGLVVGGATVVRTLLAMMLTTAEWTTQVSSPGIAWVCEKSNAAMHAMSDTTLQFQSGMRRENRVQRVLILPHKRISTLVQMPILAKRKELTDGDDKKARDSVTISNRINTHLVLLHRRESIERQHEVFS